MRTMTTAAACLAIALSLLAPNSRAEVARLDERIDLADWLLLPKVGSSGRVALPANPVTHSLVTGTFQPPKAGDTVPAGAGKQAVWTAVEAPEEGPLRHEFLLGGWAYAKIASAVPRRAILRAKGHAIAYVNGEPRVSNVYRYGYVMIPIQLEAGDNHLLFRCVRYGSLEAWLEPVTHDLMVNTEDPTLPEAVRGERRALEAGLVVINTTTEALEVSEAQGSARRGGAHSIALPNYWMPPLSIAKLPVKLPARRAKGKSLTYRLSGERVQPAEFTIDVVEPGAYRKVTFRSEIEGSVQYYGYRPRREPHDGEPPALFLHMHGASDEATAYRNLYYAKPWCAMASATNRRPFGFGWEAWGRIDALEVLEQATELVGPDPSRIYLGGHSMGGHGVWLNGALYPDKFAAIGPGAGWQDVWTYARAQQFTDPSPVQAVLQTATNPSRTALLRNNFKQLGVMVLHGDADRVVSIEEAHAMAELLEGAGHSDLTMVIEPGGGHVWDTTPEVGHSCFDSTPLFEFFQRHARPVAPQRVDFTTVMPSISGSNHWLRIEQQGRQMEPSRARLQIDPGRRWLHGKLENVERFSVDPSALMEPGAITLQFDNDKERTVEWTGGELHFALSDEGWQVTPPLDRSEKGPHRSGSARTVLMSHRPVLVVGTNGTPKENAWALRKARFDNETMWYRGNGSFEIVLDSEYDPSREPDRNVLLYGNANTNLLWDRLLGDSPVTAGRGRATVGERSYSGNDLALVGIRPRPGSETACVGFIAGTGLVGMRATNELSIFTSGIYRPDFALFSADSWSVAEAAVHATGFFGNDWTLESGLVAWADSTDGD